MNIVRIIVLVVAGLAAVVAAVFVRGAMQPAPSAPQQVVAAPEPETARVLAAASGGRGARRGTRARRARRRAASAPRIAPEGRRDADAWDASREVTQAAVDSCAVAEPPSM